MFPRISHILKLIGEDVSHQDLWNWPGFKLANTDVAWRELSDVRTVCMSMWQVEKHGGSGILLFQSVVDVAADVFECFLVVTVSWYSRFLKVLGCCFLLLLPLSLSRSLFYRRSTRWFECAILTAMARQFSVAHKKPWETFLLNITQCWVFDTFSIWGFSRFRTMIEWFPLSSRKVEIFVHLSRWSCWGRTFTIHFGGQIIATSHDLTPNGGLVREIPFQGNLGWWMLVKYYTLARFWCHIRTYLRLMVLSACLFLEMWWSHILNCTDCMKLISMSCLCHVYISDFNR